MCFVNKLLIAFALIVFLCGPTWAWTEGTCSTGASTIASMMKFYDSLNSTLTCNGNAGANPTYLMPFPSTLPIIYQEGSPNGYGNGVNTIISNCNRSTNDILSLEIYQSDVDHVS